MARLARIVLPGVPYHVTERGNRRQQTLFDDVAGHPFRTKVLVSPPD